MFTTRFAPSPTGYLHLGHSFSALTGWSRARAAGGRFVLRIEDIDTTRCRPEFDSAILADLAWLGIDWDGPVWRQSQRGDVYAAALSRLRALRVVYPCFCTRADIAAAATAPHGGTAAYPGTCRQLDAATRAGRMLREPFAWRLDIVAALAVTGPLAWHDELAGTVSAAPEAGGDVVVARKDIGTSYHLAVTIDDAAQGVTHVVRGTDLFAATHVQRLLQALLDLPTPLYHGRRLAKRDRAATLRDLRAAGADPAVVRRQLLDG